jgi:hypothetical protein
MSKTLRFLALPLADVLYGQQRTLARPRDLAWMLGGLVLGWWVYVPLHELLHAFGCLVTGGEVSRLEIDPMYGGALLARVFPWVVSGGEYAGRLSGFDTGGSDVVYLATDLAPFLLALAAVWALRRAARAGRPGLFGMAAPFALAPFLSLTGDAYEIGSILVTRMTSWRAATELLRGDDVGLVAERLAAAPDAPWGGFVVACLVGVAWAWATYWLGGVVARALGEPAIAAPVGAAEASPVAAVEPRSETVRSSTANCQ